MAFGLIGGFVVGAAVLMAAAVLILGGGKFFEDRMPYVMYFDGSVKGLGVGSKVQFKGVDIGEVKDIVLVFNKKNLRFFNRVLIETRGGSLATTEDIDSRAPLTALEKGPEQLVNDLINRGLRAKLDLESFVTGKLLVALDFYPESTVRLRGIDRDIIEIPTVPTEFEKIAKTLQQLDIDDLVHQAKDTLRGINELANSTDLRQAIAALNQTLQKSDQIMYKIDSDIGPLLNRMDRALVDYGRLARSLDRQVQPMAAGITGLAQDGRELVQGIRLRIGGTLDAVERAAAQAEKTLIAVEATVGEGSVLQTEVTGTLDELRRSAGAVRQLADYLDRHPEALLWGKQLPEK